ncbi:extracellular solute-binding protein [Mesorhizobium sp. RP14(2022)]|uniref:Extracellular solute-binding protein n=1 Tax=Mesorhizobium liriopis TaxID=2953882 RepID=A0ABT1C9E6_9HYPH|nr:extracellular solute-binding protein [Mesorhizobium liriopis]MCO6051459.1 extracellular solute-binding protein [Mesorhizobium liriopis]
MTRSTVRGIAWGTAAVLFAVSNAWSADWQTSSSLLGDSKYGQNFQHYDYVNPDAPKGGTLNTVSPGTFDSFNPYIVRGTPAAGFGAFGGGLLYDTLMEQSVDEPSVSHALVAEAYKYPDDYSSATYRLNPAAKWHDGQPITAEDVIWSFNVLKKNSPQYNRYYENVSEAVALNDHEVEFRFDQKGNRELPKIMGDLAVLPKHWWEGTDAQGRKRDITQPTLEPPLGSAAYRIESFKPGSEIVWARVPNYWGAKLPVKLGRENFDKRRYTYIQDENAAFVAFTKGGLEDINPENSSRRWNTAYNFPAVQAGDVIKKEFEASSRAFMQGYVMNTRRPLFQDVRVRQALTYAFDFETMNRTVLFNSSKRTSSYYVGSELASSGVPQGRELEILSEFKDKLPPALLTEPFKLPVYDTPQAERTNLREAVRLLGEAGWAIKGRQMVNAKTGEVFRFQMLGKDATDEVIFNPLITNLRKIGIQADLRIVDPTQYVNRVNGFDFDMITTTLPQSDSPGNEQRDYWSTRAADAQGSRNYSGIKNPVVDALIDKVIFAKDRDELLATTHALDRVLLWNFYVIPQYHRPEVWLAYWNKFGIPAKQPTYIGPDVESWWVDPEKEKALAAKYRSVQ